MKTQLQNPSPNSNEANATIPRPNDVLHHKIFVDTQHQSFQLNYGAKCNIERKSIAGAKILRSSSIGRVGTCVFN